MSEQKISPFVPGARVAITDGWDNWREGFVEKAHKTGRFTLKGSDQQWRPNEPSGTEWGYKYWRADKTGGGYGRSWLRIWDDEADSDIKEIFAKQARKNRHKQLRERFDRVSEDDLTDAMLDKIESALPIVAKAEGRS